MNLTRISKSAGVTYLLKTIMQADGRQSPKGPMAYYHQKGNNPGIWLGSGLKALDINSGDTATKAEAVMLFNGSHPRKPGEFLGAITKDVTREAEVDILGNITKPAAQTVAGFDLTFRIPKSISIMWGTGDRWLQAVIEQAHDDAVKYALKWFEENVASTRSGAGGVATSQIKGIIAIGYKHFESRAKDPHLHTHVAVANKVQRAYDDKWLTLDGRAIYRNAVAASEVHENILLDILHQRLGFQFIERSRPGVTSRSVVADVAGFPTDLIAVFSTRDMQVRAKEAELTAKWRTEHNGGEPPLSERNKIKEEAFRSTRLPKEPIPASLEELTTRWRRQLKDLGYHPNTIKNNVIGHNPHIVHPATLAHRKELIVHLAFLVIAARNSGNSTITESLQKVQPRDVTKFLLTHDDDKVFDEVATQAFTGLAKSKTTWTRGSARAEAERLTRLVRCPEGERDILLKAITDKVIELCVPVTRQRYQIPAEFNDDLRLTLDGFSVFDTPRHALFTSQQLLDNETYLANLTSQPTDAFISETTAKRALTKISSEKPDSPLSADQFNAAQHLLTNPNMLSMMVGPAGAGKTRTMTAVTAAWQQTFGKGTVIGVAPSAKAAEVLRKDLLKNGLPIATYTVAKLLYENNPDTIMERKATIRELTAKLDQYRNPIVRGQISRRIADLEATQANWKIPPGTLIIVDEASMCSTSDLAALGRLAQHAGARLNLLGDPAQLDSVDAGGFLGWQHRETLQAQQHGLPGKTVELTSLFRFKHEWEKAASLRLRKGDVSVLFDSDKGTRPLAAIIAGITEDRPHEFGYDPARIRAEAERLYRNAGEFTYADMGRIHGGPDEEMRDAAFNASRAAQLQWVTETNPETGQTTRRRKTTVLIAATNDQVADLNWQTTLARRSAGEVDNQQTVPLRTHDGGVGDQILARRNERIDPDTGDIVFNGELLTLTRILANGDAVCRRVDDGATLTLTKQYLHDSCELGYAVTVHRTQGITVDEGFLFIPYGARLTRELAYVGMTRGRENNQLFHGLPTDEMLAEENLARWAYDPKTGAKIDLLPTANQLAAKALAIEGAEHTATEQITEEATRVNNLATLVREHGVLGGLAEAAHLKDLIATKHGPQIAERFARSQAWDAMVTVWRRAYAIDPEYASHIMSDFRFVASDAETGQATFDGLADHRELLRLVAERDKARAAWEFLTNPGAREAIIATAQTRLDNARTQLAAAEAEWAEKQQTTIDGAVLPSRQILRLQTEVERRLTQYNEATSPKDEALALKAAADHLAECEAAIHQAAPDLAAKGHKWLANALDHPSPSHIDDPAWLYGLVVRINVYGNDPLLKSQVAQNETMIAQRVTELYQQATGENPPAWLTEIPTQPEPDTLEHEAWQELVTANCIYRELWAIPPDAPGPCGPEIPDTGSRNQAANRREVTDLLNAYNGEPVYVPDRRPDPIPPQENPEYWDNIVIPEIDAVPIGADWTPLDTDGNPIWEPLETPEPDPEPVQRVRKLPDWRDNKPEPADPAVLAELAAVNQAAWEFWQQHANKSWVPKYLASRGLAQTMPAAYCPAGWTTTLEHLRNQGFTDNQIIAADIAYISKNGNLIDTFRDRLPIPISDNQGRIAGFITRANPHDNRAGNPKYRNTKETDLYHKKELLYGLDDEAKQQLATGLPLVLVEGPMDVAAIRASGVPVVPVAACGTAITPNHLAALHQAAGGLDGLLIGLDNDNAGQASAAKIFAEQLGDYATTARRVTWPGAKDPGELIEQHRPKDIHIALETTEPLAVAWARHKIIARTPKNDTLRYADQQELAEHLTHKVRNHPIETQLAVYELICTKLPQADHEPLNPHFDKQPKNSAAPTYQPPGLLNLTIEQQAADEAWLRGEASWTIPESASDSPEIGI